MLLDRFLPDFQFREIHSIEVRAEPPRVFAALKAVAPSELTVSRFLMAVRSVPRWLAGGARATRGEAGTLLKQAMQAGFIMLGEEPDRELVLGLVAQPWRLVHGRVERAVRTPADYLGAHEPDFAKIATNFRIESAATGPTGCRVCTETRVWLPDAMTTRRFARYWMFIRPGSGLIRREWLRRIKIRAEGMAASSRDSLT